MSKRRVKKTQSAHHNCPIKVMQSIDLPNNDTNEYWHVPVYDFGKRNIPRLILGDHGFLKKYGSKLGTREICERMKFATKKASIGLSGGDQRCLRIAHRVSQETEEQISIFYHTDIRLTSGGRRLHFGRCMSSLYRVVAAWSKDFTDNDPIVGAFLKSYLHFQSYSSKEIMALDADRHHLTREANIIHQMKPSIISVGGDYLDFLIASQRHDLGFEIISHYRSLCAPYNTPLIFTSYTGYLTLRGKVSFDFLNCFDGLMIPVNIMGYGMIPSRSELLDWAKAFGKPLIAMHALGSGRIDLATGLNYVYKCVGLACAVIGASNQEHIQALISEARLIDMQDSP